MVNTYMYGEHSRQSLDVYSLNNEPTGAPVIIFWHGGSWKGGDKSQYRFVGKAFLRVANTVIIPNYRLYPEVKFPTFIEDGAKAVAWVAQKYPNSKIVLAGHSAGAHIASMLTFEDTYLKNAGVNIDRIGGFIGVSGPYNFTLSPKIEPVFSNISRQLWNPIDRIKYSKPSLLIYGKRDRTVATSNSEDLSGKLVEQGEKPLVIRYPLFGHINILAPFVLRFHWFSSLRQKIEKFIEEAQQKK